MDKENKVYIRRQLGASPEGEQDGQYIALNEISRLHWDDITGGFQKRTPYPQIMGYVDPADAPKVRCSGRHDYSRYGIKVCLIRSKNIVRSVGKSAASGAGMSVCKTTDMHKNNS